MLPSSSRRFAPPQQGPRTAQCHLIWALGICCVAHAWVVLWVTLLVEGSLNNAQVRFMSLSGLTLLCRVVQFSTC
jgi:hypothetical protein